MLTSRTTTQCQCNHDPVWLKTEIEADRNPQEFRTGADGEIVLVCLRCGELWNHQATDRLIDLIMEVYR